VWLLKTLSISLAVIDESEHDRRMIAIGLLFVRMLCDCFKSRPRLEAEILVLRHQLNVLQSAHAAPSTAFALDRPRPCSVARRLFFDGDIMSLEKSPDRGVIAWNSLLAHRRNDLVQGQRLGDQSQQPFHVLFQRIA
jgi:hypothetical protein